MSDVVLLLGDPVGQSLSPVLQNAAFQALGLDIAYGIRQVTGEQLAATVDEIRSDRRIVGANVTIPHKQAIVPLLDGLNPLAKRLGAVNSVSRGGSGLKGWNTDVHGFERALDECGYHAAGRHCVILGAGGAARAVAAVLQRTAIELWVIARDLERARHLCEDLGIDRGAAMAFEDAQPLVARADLVVNATPVDLPPPTWVRPGQQVFDLRSRRSREGRAMLLHQGAAAFEIWTGRAAPLEIMRAALDRAASPLVAPGGAPVNR
jgi:shikimate dehydrogenase